MNYRRFTSILLMLLMLTPSMVCFMAVCPEKAYAAIEKPVPPCHETEKSDSTSLMFMGDCTQNDLGQASTFDMPLPLLALFFIAIIVPAVLFSLYAFAGMRPSGVDPPFRGRASFHRILITQRILQ